MTTTINTNIKLQLLQLDRIKDTRTKILSEQEELGSYLADISALYAAIESSCVSVSDTVSHCVVELEVAGLPGVTSDIERYLRVEISTCLPSLLKHTGDTHVIQINSLQDTLSLSLQLPCTASLSLLSISLHLLYKSPCCISHLLPDNKQTFSRNIWEKMIKTETRPGHCYSSGNMHNLIERYIGRMESGEGARTYCLTFRCVAGGEAGGVAGGEAGGEAGRIAGCCVRQVGEREYQIKDIPVLSILEALVAVRKVEAATVACNVNESVQDRISLSSSVSSLMLSYFDLRSIA